VITVRPWQADAAIATLDEALEALNALAVALRSRSGPQPIGIPTQLGVLRGLLQCARLHVRDAITTGAILPNGEVLQ